MKRFAISILCLSALVAPRTRHVRGDDVKEPPRPEALNALELYAGEWKIEAVNKVAEWTPKELRVTGTDSCQWALKKRFMTIRGTNTTLGSESLFVIGYDEARGVYTGQFFDSFGTSDAWQGTFDPKTKTFTWKNERGDFIGRGQTRFTENTNEGFVLIKDRAGKVYFDMTFKNTRKK